MRRGGGGVQGHWGLSRWREGEQGSDTLEGDTRLVRKQQEAELGQPAWECEPRTTSPHIHPLAGPISPTDFLPPPPRAYERNVNSSVHTKMKTGAVRGQKSTAAWPQGWGRAAGSTPHPDQPTAHWPSPQQSHKPSPRSLKPF